MQSDDVNVDIYEQSTDVVDVDQAMLPSLIHGSMSGELAIARGGRPVMFPLTPFFDEDRGTIVVTSPVAFAGKARALEHDPRVAMLLHDDTGEYLVIGDAQVNDDVEANGAYIRQLNNSEPPTPKREANEEKYAFIESRLGNAIIGWLGKRIIIEIEPKRVLRLCDEVSQLIPPVWPAVDMSHSEASQYQRGILTHVGADGYPVVHPLLHLNLDDEGVASFEPGLRVPLMDGQPACLLLHWHDDASVYFGQRVIRGRLQAKGDTYQFSPGSSTTLRNRNRLDTARFIIEGRRKTKAYYKRRAESGNPINETTRPAGPDEPPLVGSTLRFLRDPSAFYRDLPTYGDMVRYRVGWHTWTAIFHPTIVERVLVNDSHRFERYTFDELGFDFVEEGLFFTKGEQWRRQRKALQPAFAPANIAPFTETIVTTLNDTIDTWDDGETIVANRLYSNLVLAVLSATLFDLDLDERRDIVTEAGHALTDRVDTQSISAFLPAWVPTRRNRRFNRQMSRFGELVDELIEERRVDEGTSDDMLSTLLDLADEGEAENGFTDEEIRHQLVTFLFAGHETTALALTYATMLLAQHEEVRSAMEEEVAEVCGDRDPTFEDLKSLTLTERVVKESMRMYPPIYVLFRTAKEDVTIDGVTVPEGSKVAIPQFIIHADERWWEHPDTFDPDRFREDRLRDVPEYAYFPFGGGPRHCVGMRFAMMFVTLALATIVRRARFETVSEYPPKLRLAATLAPEADIELRVKKLD